MEQKTQEQSPKAAGLRKALREESRDALLRLAITSPVRDAIARKKEERRPVGRPRKPVEQSSDAVAHKEVRRPVVRELRPRKPVEKPSNAVAHKEVRRPVLRELRPKKSIEQSSDAIVQKEVRSPVGRSKKAAEKPPNAITSRKRRGGWKAVNLPTPSTVEPTTPSISDNITGNEDHEVVGEAMDIDDDDDKLSSSPAMSHRHITVAQGKPPFHALNAHNLKADECEKIDAFVTSQARPRPTRQRTRATQKVRGKTRHSRMPASRPYCPPRGSEEQIPSFRELMVSLFGQRHPPLRVLEPIFRTREARRDWTGSPARPISIPRRS